MPLLDYILGRNICSLYDIDHQLETGAQPLLYVAAAVQNSGRMNKQTQSQCTMITFTHLLRKMGHIYTDRNMQ